MNSQVGRNWDKVCSEIKHAFPNTSEQSRRLLQAHLLCHVERHVMLENVPKGKRVYFIPRFGFGVIELNAGDMYVDPATHVLTRYSVKRS